MIIYKTTNLINGKIYIGQDSNNNPKYLGGGIIFYNVIKKYGRNNFKKEILEQCETFEQLNEREIYWINFYNSTNSNIGYNLSKGGGSGNFGYKFTEEQKQKIGKAHSNVILQFDLQGNFIKEWPSQTEIIKKIKIYPQACLLGKDKHAGGFKWKYRDKPTPEFISKVVLKPKIKTYPKYFFKKVLQLNPTTNQIIKIWDNPYQIQKELDLTVFDCLHGSYNILFGFKWIFEDGTTPKFKSTWQPKKILQIDPETNKIIKIWDYMEKIIKELNWWVSGSLKGITKTSYGFKWVYEEEYNKINNLIERNEKF